MLIIPTAVEYRVRFSSKQTVQMPRKKTRITHELTKVIVPHIPVGPTVLCGKQLTVGAPDGIRNQSGIQPTYR
jgi:hypothetical protein